MASNQNVTATLRLNGQQQFANGMQRAADKSDRLGRAMHGMGHAAKIGFSALAAGAAVGIGALAAQIPIGLTSLERIDRIHRQTVATIKSTAGVARVSAQHIEELGTSIEGLTGSEQETTQMGQNMLLTFTNVRNGVGKGNDIFDQATRTMVDMGRAFDKTGDPLIDLNKTAIQLGKALNDPVKGITALKKVGVTFDASQVKTIKGLVAHNNMLGAQKVILKELNKEFGGSAKAFGESITGRVERAKHAFGTLQETIASAFLPALEGIASWLQRDGIPLMNRFGAWALPLMQRGLAALRPYAVSFVAWLKTTRPFVQKLADNVRSGLVNGLHNLEGSLHRNAPMLQELWRGLQKLGPALMVFESKQLGEQADAFFTALGAGLDITRVLASGFLQLSRAALTSFKAIVDGAAYAFGWMPGLGGKLKHASHQFDTFVDGANATLSGIEKQININVDTQAADAALAAWHPAVNGVGLGTSVGVSSPAVIAGKTPASGRKGSGTILQTVVQIDRKPVARAVSQVSANRKAWR